ncbi:hypothetical protein HG535_0B06260 [Zygotorulaspora mrakii]|uniref:CRAL-TRIO domain-containing protein n=1 Tax=Zygotorulaspora mrakii TaxID=42260 RepID=A0A7H9AZ26_ZYGMR|nr:uncharacterized protein HG535_0B06260 [Zygotorulaspora mrakii]QLG71581.1 hypothetical protein HG535_0B06260 [Zygotorulaspora mrakii]
MQDENDPKKLSGGHEQILKQVWTYLFHFWGIPVNGERAFRKIESHEADTSVEEKGKKKKSLFDKISGGYLGSESSEEQETPVETEESKYVLNSVHDTLKDLEPQATQDEFWEMLRVETPDTSILKFIRARKWKVDKAMSMIAHSMRWRVEESKVDDIICGGERAAYEKGETGVIKNLELQKAIICGFDKQRRPIILARPKVHYSSDQTEEEIQKYCVLVIEQAKLFFKKPVETSTILFDLTGFSLSNMDYTPVKFLITCFEAHYPESLGHMFIHKAPWIFPPIWNIIKNWLDPVVASKIMFTKNAKDLNQFIDMDQIPEYLGGSNKHDMDHYVAPDGCQDVKLNDQESMTKIKSERSQLIKEFIDATVKWIESSSEADSEAYLNEKTKIGDKLVQNYSELDPYVRSRSVYDISGMLKV